LGARHRGVVMAGGLVADAESFCDELSHLVERGPGEDAGALVLVMDALQALEAGSRDEKLRGRLRYMFFHFEEWFHDARWRSYGPTGERLRTYLHSEIDAVRRGLAGHVTMR
jgi:hypothetical protein